MSFVPADGTNSETANSYTTVEYADAFHTLRGNTLWDGPVEARQAALVRATDYVDQNYAARFNGCSVVSSGLAWPRFDTTYSKDVIPDTLKKAVSELALEALTGNLNPATGGTQAVVRKKVDVIEVEYAESVTARKRPSVDGFLSSLLSGSMYNRPVVRV